MSKPIVPNIPPLSSVADPNTRLVLQAIVDQLNVRNGAVGTGEHKFLTAADLTDAISGKNYSLTGSASNAQRTVSRTINGFIAKTIQSLTDQLQQSFLWKKLEERLLWIETPTWFQGKFGAAVESEQLVRQSETTALASHITTAVANINGNLALAREELTATANLAGATASSVTNLQTEVNGVRNSAEEALSISNSIDGQLTGSWSVKFQTGPAGFEYVTGVGLGVTNETGAPSSSFIVKADTFAIGGPSIYVGGVLQPTIVPFQVKTSAWVDGDGLSHPAGVYMSDVMITNANVDNLTVDFAKVTGNLADSGGNWYIGRNGSTSGGEHYKFNSPGGNGMTVDSTGTLIKGAGGATWVYAGGDAGVMGNGASVRVGPGGSNAIWQEADTIQFQCSTVTMDATTKAAFLAALGL